MGGNDLRMRLGNGDGTFPGPKVLLDAGVSGVTVGDVSQDGNPDMAAAHFGAEADELSVFLGNGDGTFRDRLVFSPGLDDGPLAAADLNGDGWVDLVVGNQEAASISVLLNS